MIGMYKLVIEKGTSEYIGCIQGAPKVRPQMRCTQKTPMALNWTLPTL